MSPSTRWQAPQEAAAAGLVDAVDQAGVVAPMGAVAVAAAAAGTPGQSMRHRSCKLNTGSRWLSSRTTCGSGCAPRDAPTVATEPMEPETAETMQVSPLTGAAVPGSYGSKAVVSGGKLHGPP